MLLSKVNEYKSISSALGSFTYDVRPKTHGFGKNSCVGTRSVKRLYNRSANIMDGKVKSSRLSIMKNLTARNKRCVAHSRNIVFQLVSVHL